MQSARSEDPAILMEWSLLNLIQKFGYLSQRSASTALAGLSAFSTAGEGARRRRRTVHGEPPSQQTRGGRPAPSGRHWLSPSRRPQQVLHTREL